MQTVELFCGTKSFSKVCAEYGCDTFTADFNEEFKPDIAADILTLTRNDFPDEVNILWASPPCNCFSVASIGKYWNTDYTPKEPRSVAALEVLKHTLQLIEDINPDVFIIENPHAMMRKMPFMQKYIRNTTTYCQYGEAYMKPTDLWSNIFLHLKDPCRNGSSCHVSAPRGSSKGLQGVKGKKARGIVPEELCRHIFLTSREHIYT